MVAGGNNTGSSVSAIEFYGTGIDTPFSADRIYWLISENQSGKPILPIASAPSGSPGPSSFSFSVLREDRTTYFSALLNGDNNDNFFGATVTSDPVDQDLEVAHIDSSSTSPATLDLSLQGATDQQEHSVTVQVNGSAVGQMDFQNQILARQSFSVDSSLLHEGTNTVTLTALEGDNDVSVVQYIQLNYAHTYTADSDWLRATVPAGAEMRISGFTNAQIRLFDISNPLDITQITGKITADSGLYDISFALPGNSRSSHTILALAADAISTPVSLSQHLPSTLDTQRAGADVVVITHPDFSADLAPLVSFRESQGHHVLLVTTDEIYDEYNYGERSPLRSAVSSVMPFHDGSKNRSRCCSSAMLPWTRAIILAWVPSISCPLASSIRLPSKPPAMIGSPIFNRRVTRPSRRAGCPCAPRRTRNSSSLKSLATNKAPTLGLGMARPCWSPTRTLMPTSHSHLPLPPRICPLLFKFRKFLRMVRTPAPYGLNCWQR